MNASRIRGIAAVGLLALGVSGVSRAQSSPATEKSSEAAPKVSADEPKGRGQQEGIKVHGHWTIEVRDPDGTVKVRREFENSLFPGGFDSQPGSAILTQLLVGHMIAVFHGWLITMSSSDPNASSVADSGGFSPTIFGDSYDPTALCHFSDCGYNLVSPGSFDEPMMLTGSVISHTAGTINFVVSGLALCDFGGQRINAQDCVTSGANVQHDWALTYAHLGTPGEPPPVEVQAGQSVAVTVAISFQ